MFNQIAQTIRGELSQQQFPDSWIEEVLTALEFGDVVGGWGGEITRKYRIASMFSPSLARFLANSTAFTQPQPMEVQAWTMPLDRPAPPQLPWQH